MKRIRSPQYGIEADDDEEAKGCRGRRIEAEETKENE